MDAQKPVVAYPAQPACPAQVVVVGAQYCAPHPVDLAVVRKVMAITEGNFTIQDVNGNLWFKVKDRFLTLRDHRVLLDANGTPILTLRAKMMTAHDRWEAYRGESTNSADLLFSAKKSSLIQFKTTLDVFLANNTKEDVCDFKIKGSWFDRSCVVYAGESTSIVAQMHKKHTVQSFMLGKRNFMVTIYPGVDYAFIIALIVILDAINKETSGASGAGAAV